MKYLKFILFILFLRVDLFAQTPDTLWTKTFGGFGGYSVQQTMDNGYIFVGSTMSFGASDSDAWLIKTDVNGDTLWTKTFGGNNADAGFSVRQTNDSGYVVVGFTKSFGAGESDVWLIKTDINGDTLWTKTFGGHNPDEAYSVQQTNDGGFIITGYTESFGAGNRDVWVLKTNANGDTTWTKTFGDSLKDEGKSVIQTKDNEYVIAGYINSSGSIAGSDVWVMKIDVNGATLWTRTYRKIGSPNAIQQAFDGGYVITGGNGHKFLPEAWLIKTDADGDTAWSKTLGSGFGNSVQQTTDGGYIIAGDSHEVSPTVPVPNSLFYIKVDASGNRVWARTFRRNGCGYSVQQTNDKGYILVGEKETFASHDGIWLIKIAPEEISSIKEPNSIVEDYQLKQNYPNPFNPVTTIIYEISKTTDVKLTIYNQLGQEIVSLVDENQSPNIYQIEWDGRDSQSRQVSSGMYLCHLKAGSFSQVRKMVLLR